MNHTFTATIERPNSRDEWGDEQPGTTHQVPGCALAPRTSSEREEQRDTVIVGLTLFAPHGADIQAQDLVRLPADRMVPAIYHDTVWRVQGEAGSWASPLTGWTPGVEIALERVTG
ncbi:hypothetical protein JOF41_007373 [Saccharothrix coeruleofusca]|uniref:hypothetical protein n=1 Tax=Saccharothrix coeruleofusca TaxID=33919 RepID=UPI001AEBA5A0|nr:hypothetical protein [Saccharothrix coeruleofusca]MBP2341119.1 hypothetical protein [Saccharothrix coeruleofusca]